jgi:prepilin-type N-terminal cleavage/methylation domain-containing protein
MEYRLMSRRQHARRESGFTLVELAISITIIGLLLVSVIKGQALIRSAEVDAVLSNYRDISAAVRAFKGRYQYLPGDFPVDATTPEIAGVSAACLRGGGNGGDGNGRIDANATLDESVCVAEHLIRAGFLMGDPAAGLASQFGVIRVVRLADSATQQSRTTAALSLMPTSVTHVVELSQLPCEVAKAIDLKLDDGNLNTGSVLASVSSCTSGNVPFMAIPLQ